MSVVHSLNVCKKVNKGYSIDVLYSITNTKVSNPALPLLLLPGHCWPDEPLF